MHIAGAVSTRRNDVVLLPVPLKHDQAGIEANVGFEIGTPAYPSPVHDPKNQLPLTTAALGTIVSDNLKPGGNGFFWEIFKPPDDVCGQSYCLCYALALYAYFFSLLRH